MSLPAEVRHRWGLDKGGAVEITDLGNALLVLPAGQGGVRALVAASIEEAGGYAALAQEVADEEPELA